MSVAWKIARRELRAGLTGFRVLIICLALGVAAIASVTSVRENISAGLEREGATLLGGDAELEFTYRFATEAEKTWLENNSDRLSVIADFGSMLSHDEERALTQVKAVDAAYPLTGHLKLSPEMPISAALQGQDNLPGLVAEGILIERLGLSIGDAVQIGGVDFVLMAELAHEPDNASAGFSLGPRSLVSLDALKGTPLLAAGTLYETAYRLDLPLETDLDAFRKRAKSSIADGGFRWRDARNAAPGMTRFIDRISSFLVLVGLAGLAVGGVGVSAAVRAYLERKTSVIATLKTLGAERNTIFAIYFMQMGILSFIAIMIGLVIGAAVPFAAAPYIATYLPISPATGLHAGPLIEAAVYGVFVAGIFVLWPLARAEKIRPAALYREAQFGLHSLPRMPYLIALAGMISGLIFSAVFFAQSTRLVLWTFAALAASFVFLLGISALTSWCARGLARHRFLRGLTSLRLALGSIGGPGNEATSVILSLGLGLTVLSSVGQIDVNLRGAISRELPNVAPSYFVVDIQPGQIEGFVDRLKSDDGVKKYETAPMLRGIISKVNGIDARKAVGPHWVIRGDRGITYANEKPNNAEITAGTWWPENYTGDPQISFAAQEAEEMGLELGDALTVNILGRDIVGEITSFREVDFSNAGMGFVLTMNANALAGAPHTHIATIYADEKAEAPLIRDLAKTYPNITTIRVRDAIERVVSVLKSIAAATTLGAAATLVTGAVVLIGAAAAGEEKRRYEAAILKSIGASRRQILGSFALRSLILGLAAGSVAILTGLGAAWAVLHFVMEAEFSVSFGSVITIVFGGVFLTMGTSIWFSWRAMRVCPARVLRDAG